MRVPSLPIVVVLAAAALVPFATTVSADHVYTHRYIIQGHVVDAAGDPVRGADVLVELDGWLPNDEVLENICSGEPGTKLGATTFATRTGALGAFRTCVHVHDLVPAGKVVVTVGNTTVEGEKDREQRSTYFKVQIAEGDAGTVGDTTSYHAQAGIRGRVWRALDSEQRIEGNLAFGVTPAHVPVEVTLQLADGTTHETSTTASSYGEFTALVEYAGDLTGATFVVSAAGGEDTVPADPTFRVFDWDLVLPADEGANGSGIPGAALALGALAVAAGVGAVATRSRRR